MGFFSSKRELRLWLVTLAVVLAIYATLGLARTLAGTLREQGVLEVVLFSLGMLLVGATIFAQGFRVRLRGVEIAAGLAVAAAYFVAFARIGSPEERTHLIEYGMVGLLVHAALAERARNGRRVPVPLLLAILITAVLGVIDECIQALLPSRVFDPTDILVNILAGAMAIGASAGLAWVRRRGRGSPREP